MLCIRAFFLHFSDKLWNNINHKYQEIRATGFSLLQNCLNRTETKINADGGYRISQIEFKSCKVSEYILCLQSREMGLVIKRE